MQRSSIFRGEANISTNGPLIVTTGKLLPEQPVINSVVREATTEDKIWWGHITSLSMGKSSMLISRKQGYFQGRDVFNAKDCFGGADPEYACQSASLPNYLAQPFRTQICSSSHKPPRIRRHVPEFTIICTPRVLGLHH